jgi:hypothetical protein
VSSAKTAPAVIGFRVVRGGAVAVGVATDGGTPRVVISTLLATAAEGDRLAFEPYHVAAEMALGPSSGVRGPREPKVPGDLLASAAEAVAEGRRRQNALAAQGLDGILGRLRNAGCVPVAAALLVNRAGWLTEDLRLPHSLSAPEHPPVIEGLAVRDALRFAFHRSGIPATEMDEKSLPETASAVLCLSPAQVDARLRELGAAAGRPWRKEQKLACLAGWVAAISP